ncbi:unnamed protein product [Callosobruchus maculatus]|uniref:PHD-type domain-containing protein n=1 Tax=Callosobruchus maculatus TaxID=64391 RepID=A0A653C8Y4_CALMS|nr:unnamed protein product [Callosobruchus maculatus]
MSRKKPPDIEKKCEICEEDIRKGSAKVNCKNPECEIVLHQKCFLAAAKAIKIDSCDWMCKNCCDDSTTSTVIHNDDDVVKELEFMKNEVRLLSQMVNDLAVSNKLLLEKMDQFTNPATSEPVKEVPLTYSQAVKKEDMKKSTAVLIVRSKDEKETNVDVMNNIKGKINPTADKIGVNYTKLIKNGILVNCVDDDSLQKLKGAVTNNFEKKYEILTPKPLRPRLVIPDVEKSVQTKDDFLEYLVQGYFKMPRRKKQVVIDEDDVVVSENMDKILGKFSSEIGNALSKGLEKISVTVVSQIGTTWAQEMVWMIMNNLDFEGAKEDIHFRVPIIELSWYDNANKKHRSEPFRDSLGFIRKKYELGPVCMKTHFPWVIGRYL